MKINPIPMEMLTESAVLMTEISRDEWGKVKYSETQLKNIAVRPAAANSENSSSQTELFSGTLYFDAARSCPPGTEFIPSKQLVVYSGKTYRVMSAEKFTAFGRSHHTKVRLGKA